MIRVLVVDDEPLIRTSLGSKIEQHHEEIVVSGSAANGAKALDWLAENYADLCVTDVKMPVMDGLALIRRLNAQYPWMSAIVVSSYDEFEYARSSMQLGAMDYIVKPIDQQQLGGALDRAAGELAARRRAQAALLLMRQLPHHQDLLQRWVQDIQMTRLETMPLLVVDTLERLESWTGDQFYLLNPLSMAWLALIVEELKKEKLEITLQEGKDLGLGEKTIPAAQVRAYFRLCAVRRLEEGAHLIFRETQTQKDHPSRKAVEEVKAYIQAHYADKLNLQELADRVAISRNYFAQLFKQETGMTIWNYLVQLRMNKARELLLGTERKVYEIACDVGYDNSVHFSQLFKEHYGLTPVEYKKRMNK